jgi:hypothetical protein
MPSSMHQVTYRDLVDYAMNGFVQQHHGTEAPHAGIVCLWGIGMTQRLQV